MSYTHHIHLRVGDIVRYCSGGPDSVLLVIALGVVLGLVW